MTVIVRQDANGETRIDLTPVEKYERLLEEACESGQQPAEDLYAIAASMDQEQLRHLTSTLTYHVKRLARLWRHSFTEEHTKFVSDINGLKKAAEKQGFKLWSELDG